MTALTEGSKWLLDGTLLSGIKTLPGSFSKENLRSFIWSLMHFNGLSMD